jgi:hypothetical protein
LNVMQKDGEKGSLRGKFKRAARRPLRSWGRLSIAAKRMPLSHWIVSQFNKAHRRELLFPGIATPNAFVLLPTPEV